MKAPRHVSATHLAARTGLTARWPITVSQCAERLHVSPRKLRDLLKEYPFYRRAGRRILFTRGDFTKLLEALPCPSNAIRLVKTARKTAGSGALTSESELTEVLRRLDAPSRRRSSGKSRNRSNVVLLRQDQLS